MAESKRAIEDRLFASLADRQQEGQQDQSDAKDPNLEQHLIDFFGKKVTFSTTKGDILSNMIHLFNAPDGEFSGASGARDSAMGVSDGSIDSNISDLERIHKEFFELSNELLKASLVQLSGAVNFFAMRLHIIITTLKRGNYDQEALNKGVGALLEYMQKTVDTPKDSTSDNEINAYAFFQRKIPEMEAAFRNLEQTNVARQRPE